MPKSSHFSGGNAQGQQMSSRGVEYHYLYIGIKYIEKLLESEYHFSVSTEMELLFLST